MPHGGNSVKGRGAADHFPPGRRDVQPQVLVARQRTSAVDGSHGRGHEECSLVRERGVRGQVLERETLLLDAEAGQVRGSRRRRPGPVGDEGPLDEDRGLKDRDGIASRGAVACTCVSAAINGGRGELMKELDELQMKLTILVWKRSGIKTVNDDVFSVTPRLRIKKIYSLWGRVTAIGGKDGENKKRRRLISAPRIHKFFTASSR